MKKTEEQGFLSDKFDDWSGEPIPNGWSKIEEKLGHRRKKRPFFWWWLPALFIGAGVACYYLVPVSQPNAELVRVESGNRPKAMPSTERSVQNPEVSQSGLSEVPSSDNPSDPISQRGSDFQEPEVLSQSGSAGNKTNKSSAPGRSHRPVSETPVAHSSTKKGHHSSDSESSKVRNLPSESAIALNEAALMESSTQSEPGSRDEAKSKSRRTRSVNQASGSVVAVSPQSREILPPVASPEEDERNEIPQSGSTAYVSSVRPVPSPGEASRESTEPEFLASRMGILNLPGTPPGSPELVPFSVLPFPPSPEKTGSVHSFTAGISAGAVQHLIELNQAEAAHRMNITNLSSLQSWFFQVSGRWNVQLQPWLVGFSGLQLGLIAREFQIQNTVKEPTGYSMEVQDSLHYQVHTHWLQVDETRKQKTLFANVELGIKPLISRSRQSGPFASLVLWSRLAELHSSSMKEGVAFRMKSCLMAPGFRVGYQHLISRTLQAELFYSSAPSQLSGETRGLAVTPRMLGIGFNWILR